MSVQQKNKAVDEYLRGVLRENIQRRMQERWPNLKNQPRKLAAAAGVSQSTIQRFISGETGMTLDTLSAIARVFRAPAYKLLIEVDEQRFFIDAREIVATTTGPAGTRSQIRNQR